MHLRRRRAGQRRAQRLVDVAGDLRRTLGKQTLAECSRAVRVVHAPHHAAAIEQRTHRFEKRRRSRPNTVPRSGQTQRGKIARNLAVDTEKRPDTEKHLDTVIAKAHHRQRVHARMLPIPYIVVESARAVVSRGVPQRPPPRDDPRKRFGHRLASLRKSRDWTQGDLAEHSGIHRSYISGLENGERNIGLLNLVRLAAALDVSPVELLRWDEPEGSGPA